MSTGYELYETTPEEALKRYLSDRSEEVSDATLYSHESRMGHFIRWCDEEEITNLNDLSGRHMQDYRYWRKNDGGLNNVTLHTQMTTFRVFIKWCEDYEAVTPGLHEKIRIPKLDRDEDVADREMKPERALKILDYLDKYQYASRKHAMFRVLFRTGVRTGGLRTIDLGDYHSGDQYIEVKHRPETDTPLKNGDQGERPIHLNAKTCQVLDDHIEKNRIGITDEYGREPLFTTSHGRMAQDTVRTQIYKISHPCFYTGDCPHDKNPQTCDAKQNVDCASQCPSSEPPHSIRKGSITYWRARDTPAEQVGERANVSTDIIEKHYDKRGDFDKMEQRKDYFEKE